MTERSLFDAVLDQGINNPNYFEGRLLTADALRDDQIAHRRRQRQLGQAIGEGIVNGLQVSLEPDLSDQGVRQTITIERGLAINRCGDTLALNNSVTVDVIPPVAKPEAPTSLFGRCADTESLDPTIPTGTGIYVLMMSPTSAFRDRAPKSGLGVEGKIIGCGDRYVVEGVSFRLEPLHPDMISGADNEQRETLKELMKPAPSAIEVSLLRNLIAHHCFGTPELNDFPVDPFALDDGTSAWRTYGALDDLRSLVDPEERPRLGDCDVPLALMLWNQAGIAFTDMWAVRRRPTSQPYSLDWPTQISQRIHGEAEARFFQFQHHLADLLANEVFATLISASAYFRFLPPAGLLPLADIGRPRGVTIPGFFAGRTLRDPVHIEGARLRKILAFALEYTPVDLDQDEMIWTYLVRENRQPATADGPRPADTTVLYTGAHLPFFGEARFDINRWDYANYSSLRVR